MTVYIARKINVEKLQKTSQFFARAKQLKRMLTRPRLSSKTFSWEAWCLYSSFRHVPRSLPTSWHLQGLKLTKFATCDYAAILVTRTQSREIEENNVDERRLLTSSTCRTLMSNLNKQSVNASKLRASHYLLNHQLNTGNSVASMNKKAIYYGQHRQVAHNDQRTNKGLQKAQLIGDAKTGGQTLTRTSQMDITEMPMQAVL